MLVRSYYFRCAWPPTYADAITLKIGKSGIWHHELASDKSITQFGYITYHQQKKKNRKLAKSIFFSLIILAWLLNDSCRRVTCARFTLQRALLDTGAFCLHLSARVTPLVPGQWYQDSAGAGGDDTRQKHESGNSSKAHERACRPARGLAFFKLNDAVRSIHLHASSRQRRKSIKPTQIMRRSPLSNFQHQFRQNYSSSYASRRNHMTIFVDSVRHFATPFLSCCQG